MKRSLSIWAVLLLCGVAARGSVCDAAVDFPRDVQPILTEHCVACHGPESQKSGLRLDYRNGLIVGGDHGPAIVPGDAARSRLILRVTGADAERPRMPFKKATLTERQIGVLQKWIQEGAVWPGSPERAPRRRSSHWAFQPVTRPLPPSVQRRDWPRNGIDSFVLTCLEAQKVSPSAEADRYTLIRRVFLDLLGLPPTPQEADDFAHDASPNAYERMVDVVLNSPAYGERWGRHWLDQARYADSNGYSIDGERTAWLYRDWVIGAINADMPFDQFTIEQLAGDLMESNVESQRSKVGKSRTLDLRPSTSDISRLIATGFHRNTLINQEGGVDNEQFRVETVVDRVNTTGSVWLGLTIGCAQCHSHKFDPITQKEYYQLLAFFNSTEDNNGATPTLALPTSRQRAELSRLDAQVAQARRNLKGAGESDESRQRLEAQLKLFTEQQKAVSNGVTTAMVMRELKAPRTTHVHIRGDFLRKGEQVEPDTPEVMPPLVHRGDRADRLDLAKWLVDPANPLTARVTVNRAWMHFFGRGLVETENDFGTQGVAPTHPELLDWLAGQFVRGGWSMKRLHRLIVTSAVYRQSSQARPELRESDPLNGLLARQERLRLEGEILRDESLAASGMMTARIGGPSVHPPQPEGVYAFTQTPKKWPTDRGADGYRRTMYTFFYRSAPFPLLTTFDAPDFQTTCTRRSRSDTPLQSLTAANDPGLFEIAQALAARVVREHETNDWARIVRMFRLCLTRIPAEQEVNRLRVYLEQQTYSFRADMSAALAVAPKDRPGGIEVQAAAAWVAMARALMNTDEFVTRE